MQKRMECRVEGRVQMVMFRDFTCRSARKLGLVGTVQNMRDGSVYVVAEGEEEKLKELRKLLWKGSLLARVENVECRWTEPSGEFEKFEIVY